jgi:hypothetical protein
MACTALLESGAPSCVEGVGMGHALHCWSQVHPHVLKGLGWHALHCWNQVHPHESKGLGWDMHCIVGVTIRGEWYIYIHVVNADFAD